MVTKKQKEPFFYILQPNISFPEANMQDVYSNREEKKKKINSSNHKTLSEEINLEKADEKPEDSNNLLNRELEKTTELIEKYNAESGVHEAETSEQTTKQHAHSFNRVKRFKEMNTQERLNYLIHFPKQLPPVPCIFETDNSSYRGTLIQKTDRDIEIKLFNAKTMELPIESIKEVRMIGLKA